MQEAKSGKADVMGGGAMMSPRKAIASGMGPGAGNFGVGSFETDCQKSCTPAATPERATLADNSRGIGSPVSRKGGGHPAQAAPDHGPTHPGGHGMHRGYKKAL